MYWIVQNKLLAFCFMWVLRAMKSKYVHEQYLRTSYTVLSCFSLGLNYREKYLITQMMRYFSSRKETWSLKKGSEAFLARYLWNCLAFDLNIYFTIPVRRVTKIGILTISLSLSQYFFNTKQNIALYGKK